jgi:hypothetical protein
MESGETAHREFALRWHGIDNILAGASNSNKRILHDDTDVDPEYDVAMKFG